jgi:hypothetical protein
VKGSGETVAILANGLTLTASCGSKVTLKLETTNKEDPIEASGTSAQDAAPTLNISEDRESTHVVAEATEVANLDVIARDSEFASFERIDAHITSNLPACDVWAMITPSG